MTQYLLSVHSVEGEARAPMTDEEMQRSWKEIQVLNEELKAARAWVFSAPFGTLTSWFDSRLPTRSSR
jgi:hypothetical protein